MRNFLVLVHFKDRRALVAYLRPGRVRSLHAISAALIQAGFHVGSWRGVHRAPGRHTAARLDLMGVTPEATRERLEIELRKESYIHSDEHMSTLDPEERSEKEAERSFRRSLTPQDWVSRLSSTQENDGKAPYDGPFAGRTWLLGQLYSLDERFALRAVLLSLPDAEVTLRLHDIDRWRDELKPSESVTAISAAAGMHASVVVLTEGRTDAEFLSSGLKILYPYLSDMIRFLDYEQKTEGGAGALVRMVRAFAAAGIVNRVVAVFDNDTAARDALRALNLERIPPQIKVMRYPPISMAKLYPTFGPPTEENPRGSTALADVNGLAGSIELYLGRDVLAGKDGNLRPVQWKSYIPALESYQGELTEKGCIQDSFRKKCRLAADQPGIIAQQDWEGIRLIIGAICDAAQSAFDSVDPT
jgi:hypothetical protein